MTMTISAPSLLADLVADITAMLCLLAHSDHLLLHSQGEADCKECLTACVPQCVNHISLHILLSQPAGAQLRSVGV